MSTDTDLDDSNTTEEVELSLAISESTVRKEGDEYRIAVSKKHFTEAMQDLIAHSDIYPEDLSKGGIGSRRREGVVGGMKSAFTEDRKWLSIFNKAPLGYEVDDSDWIQPTDEGAEIAETLFQTFLYASFRSTYKRTAEVMNEEFSHVEEAPFSLHKIKAILQKPVYIGKPTAKIKPAGSQDREEVTVEDDQLQLIPVETFEAAQEKIEEIRDRAHLEDATYVTIESLIDEYGKEVVVDALELAYESSTGEVRLECPKCESAEPLVPRGSSPRKYLPDDGRVMNYWCDPCGHQTNRPYQAEMFELMKSQSE